MAGPLQHTAVNGDGRGDVEYNRGSACRQSAAHYRFKTDATCSE
jgi:hypothetical protein